MSENVTDLAARRSLFPRGAVAAGESPPGGVRPPAAPPVETTPELSGGGDPGGDAVPPPDTPRMTNSRKVAETLLERFEGSPPPEAIFAIAVVLPLFQIDPHAEWVDPGWRWVVAATETSPSERRTVSDQSDNTSTPH